MSLVTHELWGRFCIVSLRPKGIVSLGRKGKGDVERSLGHTKFTQRGQVSLQKGHIYRISRWRRRRHRSMAIQDFNLFSFRSGCLIDLIIRASILPYLMVD